MEPRSLGLYLVAAGALLVTLGLLAYGGAFSWFGRLPGDIRYEGESTKVFVPITSMIVVSIVLTLLFSLARRFL